MDVMADVVELPDYKVVVPYLFAGIVTVLFLSMFSVLIAIFLLIYQIALEHGLLTPKRKPKKKTRKVPTEPKPETNADDGETQPKEDVPESKENVPESMENVPESKGNVPESKDNEGDAADTPNTNPMSDYEYESDPEQKTTTKTKIPRSVMVGMDGINSLINVLITTHKIYFVIIIFLIAVIFLHTCLVLIDGFMKTWEFASTGPAMEEAAKAATYKVAADTFFPNADNVVTADKGSKPVGMDLP